MKLDNEPRLSSGPALYQSLIDWARKVVQAVNERATMAWVTDGLSVSNGTAGYLKLPAWAGGLMVQWGSTIGTTNAFSVINIPFPATFPGAVYTFLAVNGDPNAGSPRATVASIVGSTSSADTVWSQATGAPSGTGVTFRTNWVAFGR